jgi:aspartate/tyrosine/aromatic aminotransferase
MGGDPTFAALSRKLAFGADCPAIAAGRIATVQSLSGTGEQEGQLSACATCAAVTAFQVPVVTPEVLFS